MIPLLLPEFQGGAGLLSVVLIAFAIDVVVGDPPALYRLLPHPVALIGKMVAVLDARFNDSADDEVTRFRRGVLVTLAVTALCFTLGWAVSYGLRSLPFGWIGEAIVASSFLAYQSLYNAVTLVGAGLNRSVKDGRRAVAHIVGRDPESLDQHGVARAAIESLAENFADGVVAPLFWFVLLGLPGLLAYKAINTLDSMIGHHTPRHQAFGKAAARLDDLVNWLPARLAGFLFFLAARLLPGADAPGAWAALRRDAPKHRSPNAGWPEAAVAGALGLALAGPRRYGDEDVDDAWMGDGRREAGEDDIRLALRLYQRAGVLLAVLIVLLIASYQNSTPL